MFIDLPFYVSAVKMLKKEEEEIGLWYLANVREARVWIGKFTSTWLTRKFHASGGFMCLLRQAWDKVKERASEGISGGPAPAVHLWEWSEPLLSRGTQDFRASLLSNVFTCLFCAASEGNTGTRLGIARSPVFRRIAVTENTVPWLSLGMSHAFPKKALKNEGFILLFFNFRKKAWVVFPFNMWAKHVDVSIVGFRFTCLSGPLPRSWATGYGCLVNMSAVAGVTRAHLSFLTLGLKILSPSYLPDPGSSFQNVCGIPGPLII